VLPPFHRLFNTWKGWQVGVFLKVIQGREVGEKQRRKTTFSSLFSTCIGEEDDGVVQNSTVLSFFFKQCMKQCRFGQNTPFHLNAKAAKTCPFSYWSSICNVFNQVLNCNFDLKINAISSLPKSNSSPIVGRLFHFSPWF